MSIIRFGFPPPLVYNSDEEMYSLASFIDLNRDRVILPERSFPHEVVYFLGRLWKIICLNVQAWGCGAKVAELFLYEMKNCENNIDDLAYDLSLLTQKQIVELRGIYFYRTPCEFVRLQKIFCKALFYSLPLEKGVLILRFLRNPFPQPPVLPPPYWKDIFDEILHLRNLYKRMLLPDSPVERKKYRVATQLRINEKELNYKDFDCLTFRKPPYNHVEQCRKRLERETEGREEFISHLDLFSLLYLYENAADPFQTEIFHIITKTMHQDADCLGFISFYEYLQAFKKSDPQLTERYEKLLHGFEEKYFFNDDATTIYSRYGVPVWEVLNKYYNKQMEDNSFFANFMDYLAFSKIIPARLKRIEEEWNNFIAAQIWSEEISDDAYYKKQVSKSLGNDILQFFENYFENGDRVYCAHEPNRNRICYCFEC